MQLASPFFLSLFIVIPLLIFVLRFLRRGEVTSPVHKRGPLLCWKPTLRSVARFSDFKHGFAASVQQMRHTPSVKAFPILRIIRFIVLALLIFSLTRPQLSQSREQTFTEGIDIFLVLDISESMRAEDFEGSNRIQTAKSVVNAMLEKRLTYRQNDRIGLVVFAGESFTLCPLTSDYSVLVELLRDIEIGQLEDGTAIGDALATATHRLRNSASKTKIVILLTDGENNVGSIEPGAAASLAQSFEIKVYTIGMGKEGGARIPYADTTFGKRYREVLTYLDEDTLKQIANITGGRYFRATDTQSLKHIYAEIDRFEKTKFETVNIVAHKELTAYFLIPAVLLLGTEILLSNTVLRKIP